MSIASQMPVYVFKV